MAMTVAKLNQLKQNQQKFACLACYDSSFAAAAQSAGIEVLLVGDSLGMVVQGHRSTVPVSVDAIEYHTRCVARGCDQPLIMADLPFMAAREHSAGLDAAMRLMQAGAHMIKIEGGASMVPLVEQLTTLGVPVCSHLGLTPQSVNLLSGYAVQAKTDQTAELLLEDARRLEQAGCCLTLVECVPQGVAAKLSEFVSTPIIGIGAGPATDGQILVAYDMLGLFPGKPARFVKNYLATSGGVIQAMSAFREEVQQKLYPAAEHSFG